MAAPDAVFREMMALAPQPIALSCGRVLRARTLPERLEAVVKAAEVLTRYVAAAALASFVAREDSCTPPPAGFRNFNGRLSFGHFLQLIQQVADVNCEHPLRHVFARTFAVAQGKRHRACQNLDLLTGLRNRRGHDLSTPSDPMARTIFAENKPDEKLAVALQDLDKFLQLPLFIVESQQIARGRITARRLLLMGESPFPMPEDIEIVTTHVGVSGRSEEGRRAGVEQSGGACRERAWWSSRAGW